MKLLFPMKHLNITQGVGGSYSHAGTNAIDCGGKDTGIDDLYAPCDMICKYKDSSKNGNACFFESTERVELANGTTSYVTMMFIHDNNISDIHVGKRFRQGDIFYQEGRAGQATGNHVHIEVAAGKFINPYVLNKDGNYMLPGSIHPALAFFLQNVIIINDGKYAWKKLASTSRWRAYSNGVWKYLKLIGKYAKNEWIYDSEYQAWYYFDDKEQMVRDAFVQHDGKWTYIQSDGKMFKGGNIIFVADNSGYLKRK